MSEVRIPPGASVRGNLKLDTVDTVPRGVHKGSYVRSPWKELSLANDAPAGTRTQGPTITTDVTRLDARDDARDEQRRTKDRQIGVLIDKLTTISPSRANEEPQRDFNLAQN